MKQPNIIYILTDDLGYGDLGCYGQTKIKTPCLDRMAAEGMRFTRHYAGAPVCGPSRACLMTGRHQGTGYIKGNPVNGNDVPLRPEDRTIAESLQTAGYATACIGKWGLGKAESTGYPTRKGFDHFYGYDSHRACHDYYPDFLWRGEAKEPLPAGTYSHDALTAEALRWVGEVAERERPFFLYLAYTIPHDPHDPPDDKPYSDERWPEKYRNYAAMITRLDRDVGRLFALLEEKGIDERAIVMFASDNGPGSTYNAENRDMVRFFRSAGDYRGMKRDVYDGGIRVPLVARWPGAIAPGVVSTHLSAFQDVFPTLAELAGAALPAGLDGISMVPELLGRSGEQQRRHERLYWEFTNYGESAGGRQSCLDAVNGWKAVRYGSKGAVELYDAEQDWAEMHNVASAHPEAASELARYMDEVRTYSELWPMPEQGWKPEGATE